MVVTSAEGGRRVNKVAADWLRAGRGLDTVTPGHLDQDTFALLHQQQGGGLMFRPAPFLPLPEEDVARCAEAAARAQGLALSPAQLRSVLDMQQVSRVGGTSLARTGCKQIASRIDIVVGPRRGDL